MKASPSTTGSQFRPGDVPPFADGKMVAFLRDRYRRKYLEGVTPDLPNKETPGGNWYELVGSSYDRTTYALEIETSPEQDQALIRKFNSLPNRSHFHMLTRNCADFVKDVINLYQPRALRARLQSELQKSSPGKVADRQIRRDLQLRQREIEEDNPLKTSLPLPLLDRPSESLAPDSTRGNRP